MTTIAIYCSEPALITQANALAATLRLPIAIEPTNYDYLLLLTTDYLGLQKTGSKSHPLYVNFLSPQMQFRQQHASLKNESLAKALGLKKNPQATIIDATGGLARDSFIIASLGFNMTLLERSPIVHALIADGIARATQTVNTFSDSHNRLAMAMQKLTLIHANAITWLPQLPLAQRPDIIYLDPMFNERKNSARPKKEMLIFHDIVGDDNDAYELLKSAIACAKQRIVVKRPRHAHPLNELSPSYSLEGNSCRFDIYLI